MDNKKKFLSRCLQLVYVVTFPVHPEDEQQFRAPECGPSDTKYSASQPVKHVSSDENDPSAPISFDRGSKGSESSDSDKFPIKGLSAEFSDTGLYGSYWPLANEVLGRNQGEQQMFVNAVSDSSQHMTQQRQKYDQRVQADSCTSSPQIGTYFGNYMQGSSVARDRDQFYDAVIVYDQSDFTEVQLFKEELTQMMATTGYPGLRLELFDSTVFPASHIMSIEDIVRRSSLVLVYLTPQFNPNRLELFCNEIIGLTRLGYNEPDVLAGRMESTQKWAFRPVHTQPERARYYKTPIGLTTVIGMNWYDRYSANTRQKIISVMAQALQDRTQRENHAQFTSRYRELSKQHRNSEQGQPYAKESFISSYNPSVPSQVIRPQYVNLYNTQNGTWMNSSHGVRTPVNPSFHQAPHIVRQSVPRAQVPYQSSGNVAQIVNMTRFQRPQLSMIPEQTLEQSGSFKSGQELHPHISTAPNYDMQHHNIGQHSLSQASVDAFSIRSQDAYSVPFQHQLYTTRPQSTMSIAQSASLSAGQLNKTDWNGHYCGRNQVSDRNISYQQVPQNAGSNVMFHETMIGLTGQARPQMGRYTPDFTTSNQCVGQSDSKAFLKDTTAYQSTGSEFNPMGVDVVNGVPFQTARIDSSIGNGVSHTKTNIIVQSASLSSQAIPVDDHSQFIPQGMQRNAQTVLSPGNPQLSYQKMTSVVNPSIQGPQRSSFLIDSNSEPQIQDNFRQPLVSYPPSEYHERRSEQIHAYQKHANPSCTPMMQMNMHLMPSVSIPSSHLPTQEPFYCHHNQQLFDESSSPSMQIPSQMRYAGTPSVRLDPPQSSFGNEHSNQMIGRQTTNNVNNIPRDSDIYTPLPNSVQLVNKQNTHIIGSGPASLYGYKSNDREQSSDRSIGLEQSMENFKPFNNKNNDEIDINPNLSNDDLEIDKIPPNSGTFHQTAMKTQINMNTSKTHDLSNTSKTTKQNDTREEDDISGKRSINHHYHGYDVKDELDNADRVVKNVTNIWGSKNVQFGANSKVITYRNSRRRSRRDWRSSDEDSSSSSSDEEKTRKQETQASKSSRSSASAIALNIHASQVSTPPTKQATLLDHQSSSEEDNCAHSNLQSGITNNLDASQTDKQPQDKKMNIQKAMVVDTEIDLEKTKSKLTVEATDSSILSAKPKISWSNSGSINASIDAFSVSGKYFGITGGRKPFSFERMLDRDNAPRIETNDISEVD